MTTDQQQPAEPELNRAEIAEQVAFYRALAEQAQLRADQYEARFESAIGDEYRRHRTAPTWRVKDLVTISGRTANASVSVSNAADFLAWFKAHRPDDVETVEQVKGAVKSAVLKGCSPNADGVIITAGGDEIAGVQWNPGGAFKGVSFAFEASAKEAYGELARGALDALALKPAEAEQPIVAAPFAPAEGDGNPWDVKVSNPWDAPAAPNPWDAAPV